MAKTGQKSVKVEVKNVILDVSANVEDLVVELEKNLRGAIGCVYVKADKMEKILKEHHEMEAQILDLEKKNSNLVPENEALKIDIERSDNENSELRETVENMQQSLNHALNHSITPTDAQ